MSGTQSAPSSTFLRLFSPSAGLNVGCRYLLLLIVVVAGLAARLYEIGYNFDGDEILSIINARKPFAEMVSGALDDKPHPPLHIVLLYLWIKVFGVSEVSARSLSLLFSGAFLSIAYGLLRRVLSFWLALGVLSIFALSPLFVYYGQQARPYSLAALLSVANLLAFLRVLELPGDRRRLAIWAMASALLLYTQYLAVVVIALEISFALFYLRTHRVAILAYGSVACAAVLPWAIAAMGGGGFSRADLAPYIAWIRPPMPVDLAWFYISVLGIVPGLPTRWLLIPLAVLGAAYLRRLAASKNLPADHSLLFLIGFGMPAVVYIVSVAGPLSFFGSRHLIAAAIAFATAIGLCLATLPARWAGTLWLVLLVWAGAALPTAFPHNVKPPWRDVAARIDNRYGSMTTVAEEAWAPKALGFYRRSGSVRLWRDLAEHEKGGRFLFACRPFSCSAVETGALQSRRFLLATWRWGSEPGPTEFNQLLLYEIRKVD